MNEPGTIATTRKLLHYEVMVAGIGVGLQTVGIDLSAVFAAGAVVAVALGFALQDILQNFVSGVILLAKRSITESDVLEVDGKIVKVERMGTRATVARMGTRATVARMGTRATVARTRDEEEIIIPNTLLVQSSVTNFTLADSLYRVAPRLEWPTDRTWIR